MDVSKYLEFGDMELRRKNIETIIKYVSSRTEEERANRWRLFTEDGQGGYTGPGPHDTPDKTEVGHPGREGLKGSDAWNLQYFPGYHMDGNMLFQTQDPNLCVVVSSGEGFIDFPAYGKKPYQNFFFHRFTMQDGLIKEYREHMNFCEVYHALGIPLPQVQFPGK